MSMGFVIMQIWTRMGGAWMEFIFRRIFFLFFFPPFFQFPFFLPPFFVALWMEPRALPIVGQCITTELQLGTWYCIAALSISPRAVGHLDAGGLTGGIMSDFTLGRKKKKEGTWRKREWTGRWQRAFLKVLHVISAVSMQVPWRDGGHLWLGAIVSRVQIFTFARWKSSVHCTLYLTLRNG
jgi:hypothetical protein